MALISLHRKCELGGVEFNALWDFVEVWFTAFLGLPCTCSIYVFIYCLCIKVARDRKRQEYTNTVGVFFVVEKY